MTVIVVSSYDGSDDKFLGTEAQGREWGDGGVREVTLMGGGFAGLMGWLVGWVGLLASDILKMVHQVRLMMFSLKMVDYSMS